MEEIACGEVGLSVDYFYLLSPREFDNILTGYFRKKETELKSAMLLNRQLMFTIISPYLKDKKATPELIYPFPWEKPPTPVIDLQAEIEAVEKQKLFWQKIDSVKKLNT